MAYILVIRGKVIHGKPSMTWWNTSTWLSPRIAIFTLGLGFWKCAMCESESSWRVLGISSEQREPWGGSSGNWLFCLDVKCWIVGWMSGASSTLHFDYYGLVYDAIAYTAYACYYSI